MPAFLHDPCHVFLHFRIAVQITVDIFFCSCAADAKIPGQAIIADPVYNAKINCLGTASLLSGNLLHGNAKNLSGSPAMNVLIPDKSIHKGRISGNVRKDPQLDLGIIRIHQKMLFITCHKYLSDPSSHFFTNGNVLQIGLRAADPAGRRDSLVKTGMNPSVFRVNDLEQSINIGGLQLHDLTVFHNLPNDGVTALQMLENLNVSGISRLCLFLNREMQFFKQDFTKLLRGIDIKAFSCQFRNLLRQPRHFRSKLQIELLQNRFIDFKPNPLHMCQNANQRLLNLQIQFHHIFLLQMLF